MLSVIGLGAAAGLLALLTPCVFPMIPITVSYFTQQKSGELKAARRNALVFAFGIIGTFTAVGFALAIFVGATGVSRFAANPWVNLAIASMFVAFAFSLFGFYEIRVPSRLLTRLDSMSRGRVSNGTVGALLMGFVFTLTSLTCTAPFVGTVLVAASRGEWQEPLVGMLAYSTAFAAPFFLLALSPHYLSRLPKSGGWLNSTKVVMGFVEIAAAVKFVSNADLVWGWDVFTREVVLGLWAVAAVVIAVYVAGRIHFRYDIGPVRVTPPRALVAAAFLGIAVWLGAGVQGRSVGELEAFLPPKIQAELTWVVNDLPATLALAKASDQRVFIDFTGYTCTNCRWMEANVLTDPVIVEALSKYRLAKLFTDGEGEMYEEHQRFQEERFGTVALPFYAVLDADGRTIATFMGLTRDSDKFAAFLEQGLRN